MTIENNENNNEAEVKPLTQADLDALKEEYETKLTATIRAKQHAFDQYHDLKAKHDLAEAEKQRIEQEKLEKEGKHSEIAESYKKKVEELELAIKERDKKYENEKLDASATKLAIEAGAEGHNVKYLARELRDKLAMNDGQVCVLDDQGKATIKSLADFVKEVKNNEVYHGLISDRKSNGGGAAGNTNGVSQVKTYKEMTEMEKVKLKREDPVLWETMRKQV